MFTYHTVYIRRIHTKTEWQNRNYTDFISLSLTRTSNGFAECFACFSFIKISANYSKTIFYEAFNMLRFLFFQIVFGARTAPPPQHRPCRLPNFWFLDFPRLHHLQKLALPMLSNNTKIFFCDKFKLDVRWNDEQCFSLYLKMLNKNLKMQVISLTEMHFSSRISMRKTASESNYIRPAITTRFNQVTKKPQLRPKTCSTAGREGCTDTDPTRESVSTECVM